MIDLASLLAPSDDRRARLAHFLGIALTLSAAKVVLHTLAAVTFFSREGPEQLPLFYVVFAAIAVMVSAGFAAVADAMRPFALARSTTLATLAVVLLLRLSITLETPAVYFALLASAHIYDIISDIVFWVAAATHFDSRELKRNSTYFFLAWAAGGALGGALATLLLTRLVPDDLMFAVVGLLGLALVQITMAERRIGGHQIPSDDVEPEEGFLASVRIMPSLVARHPYVMLLACSALMMMMLYCLCEYLWASVYVTVFPDESALAEFVAKVHIAVQVLEFGLLIAVSQALLGRTGPLARNLVFPLTSLAALVAFAFGPRLPAAVALHVNGEAVSNAIFEPANNANYLAIPRHFHGRVRTLVDGAFYPAGMASAGLVLAWQGGTPASMTTVTFMALVLALLFVVLGFGLGSLFLPTLVSGIERFIEVGARLQPPRLSTREVRRFIHASDASTRALGLMAIARQLDPVPLLDDLQTIAAHADRTTRNLLVDLLQSLPEHHANRLSKRLLDADQSEPLVALQYRLGGRAAADRARLEALSRSSRAAVAALAGLVLAGDDRSAIARICSGLRESPPVDAECRTVLIDAVAAAGRPELTAVLLALADSGPPDTIREALLALGRTATPRDGAAAGCARRFVEHPDPDIRAAAISALAILRPRPSDTAALALDLDDPDPGVRRRAIENLARRGDAATTMVANGLSDPDVRVVRAAVHALARIRSREARQVLEIHLRQSAALGARRLSWLAALPRGRQARPWRALRFVVEESNRRTLDLALEALATLGEERVIRNVRRVLDSESPRRRADAVETLLSLRHRNLATAILPLLEALGRPPDAALRQDARPTLAAVAEAARRDPDPWVRAAARLASGERDGSADQTVRAPARSKNGEQSSPSAGPLVEVADGDVDRILLLRSMPLFRRLHLDALIAVAGALEPVGRAAGEEIQGARTPFAELVVLESGVVAFREGDRELERVAAPTVLGEQALVEDVVWPHSIVAIEPCSLRTMHRRVFNDLARDFPEMTIELSRLLARRRRERPPEPHAASIAVVPFGDSGGDLDQQYLAHGIAEDIITELSRYHSFMVISRNSSFTLEGWAHDPRHVARTLGVRYVATGSVRRAGSRIHITAQLVDATDGSRIWADRYDRELGEIVAVRDQITTGIVAAVAPHLVSAQTRHARRIDPNHPTAWDLVVRARWHHARRSAADCVEAHRLLTKALALDPSNVGGHCLEASTHLAEIQFGWTRAPRASLALAAQSALTAVRLDAHEATAHTALGLVDLMSRRHRDAIARFEHAVALNPNLAIAQAGLGQAHALSGEYEPAVAQIQTAIRLSPEDPLLVYWLGHLGLAAFAAERYEEAADWGAKAVAENPDSPAGHRLLAASLAQLGRIEEASAALREVLRRAPSMTDDDVRRQVPFERMEDIDRYLEGLRRAGLPG